MDFYSECLAASARKVEQRALRERRIVRNILVGGAIVILIICWAIGWRNHVLGDYDRRNAVIFAGLVFLCLTLLFHFFWGRPSRHELPSRSNVLPFRQPTQSMTHFKREAIIMIVVFVVLIVVGVIAGVILAPVLVRR